MTVDQAVRRVVAAWLDPGPHPRYHHQWQRRLLAEWPVLGEAVRNLARLTFPKEVDLCEWRQEWRQEYDN